MNTPSAKAFYHQSHSFGSPEIIVAYPEEKMSSEDLCEYAKDILNSHRDLLEKLLQPIYQGKRIEIDVIEQDDTGAFIVFADEIIYSGSRDINLRSDFNVRLSHRFDNDGIHFFSPAKVRSPKTYLPIVYRTKEGVLGGYVLDIYPNERLHAEADYGRWPSKTVLGEYPTFKLAWDRLMLRMQRFARAKCAWRIRHGTGRE